MIKRIEEVSKKYGVTYNYYGLNKIEFMALDKEKQVQLLKEIEKIVDEEVNKIKEEEKKNYYSKPLSVRFFNSKHGLWGIYRDIGELKEYISGKKTMAVLSDVPIG